MQKTWKWGQKAMLARKAHISPQYLNDIIRGRKPCSNHLAILLAGCGRGMGVDIPAAHWANVGLRRGSAGFFQRARRKGGAGL